MLPLAEESLATLGSDCVAIILVAASSRLFISVCSRWKFFRPASSPWYGVNIIVGALSFCGRFPSGDVGDLSFLTSAILNDELRENF